jgi:hypothetical protein
MVESEEYCIDILTQVSATTKVLQSVALGLLDEHLSHCVVQAAAEAVRKPTRRSGRSPRPSPGSCAPAAQPRQPLHRSAATHPE